MTETAELVLVPLSREGAEVLYAAAHVGLEGADPQDIDVDAGEEAANALRRALDTDAEAEVAVVQGGIRALEAFFSHDKELVLIDPDDGVGILAGEDYTELYRLLVLLRDGKVEGTDRAEFIASELVRSDIAVARVGHATATVRLDPDPDPDFAETHLRVTLTCDPPPRGSDGIVYSGPILVGDAR